MLDTLGPPSLGPLAVLGACILFPFILIRILPPASTPGTPAVRKSSSYFSGYELGIRFWRMAIYVFFREIRSRSAYKIPRDGPVLFVGGPHHNQFLDPLLMMSEVLRETGRHVQLITAAKSFTRKDVGPAIRMMETIPVARAADSAVAGLGLIRLHPTDPLVVLGSSDAQFKKQLGYRSTIQLKKELGFAAAEVAEVISDQEVRLRNEFAIEGKGDAVINATDRIREALTVSTEGVSFKALPYIDQSDMYASVFERLRNGASIGIFPEGGSHDQTDLLPLRAGVTIMALGAMASDPNLRVKICPVGLSYFHAHKFRSRAVVEFGNALDVPPELVVQYAKGGKDKREACAALLEMILQALKSVTLRAPDYETLTVIQSARRLYKVPGQSLNLSETNDLNKRFMEGYLHFKDEPRVAALRKSVLHYNRSLRDLGLRDHQVERASNFKKRSLAMLIYRLSLLLVWSLLALPGVILHAPIFIPAKILSHKKAKEALAASTVKIAARDVLATWKILISVAATPILYGTYAVLATLLAYRLDAPRRTLIWMPFVVVAALPIMALSALKFGEAAMDVLKSLRPLFINLIPGNNIALQKLKRERKNVAEEVASVINMFAPQLYEDFAESRYNPANHVRSETGSGSESDEGKEGGHLRPARSD